MAQGEGNPREKLMVQGTVAAWKPTWVGLCEEGFHAQEQGEGEEDQLEAEDAALSALMVGALGGRWCGWCRKYFFIGMQWANKGV